MLLGVRRAAALAAGLGACHRAARRDNCRRAIRHYHPVAPMLNEPPPTQADLHFRLLGVPVRVHPFFWIVALLLGLRIRDPIEVLLWMGCVFVSILVHEFGHVLAYRFFGWSGRIVLHGFGGLAIREEGYGTWNTRYSDDQYGWKQIFISLAGPAAGFVLAGLIVATLFAVDLGSPFAFGLYFGQGPPAPNYNLAVAIYFLLQINILWGVINLLPVYPLDGGQVFRELLLMVSAARGIHWSLMLSTVTAGAVAVTALLAPPEPMIFAAFLFGYLAYQSYATLQHYVNFGNGGGGW
jgi:stage IV sporulation protein FB